MFRLRLENKLQQIDQLPHLFILNNTDRPINALATYTIGLDQPNTTKNRQLHTPEKRSDTVLLLNICITKC